MENEKMFYIPWFDAYWFESKMTLGTKGVYYIFEATYNVRSESWHITISTEDGLVLIQNQKLVLNVDLLEFCFDKQSPDCALIPLIDNDNINTISYENMINETVKLVHITAKAVALLN